MKVRIDDCNLPPVFVPVKVTIELETKEDASAFYHILNCWDQPGGCAEKVAANRVASEIRKLIPQKYRD